MGLILVRAFVVSTPYGVGITVRACACQFTRQRRAVRSFALPQLPGLFEGCNFFFRGDFVGHGDPPKAELVRMAGAGGVCVCVCGHVC